MRILVTGGTGQLGRALARLAPDYHTVVALGSDACDVADPDAIRRVIDRERPELIIHSAAMTDVDGCEREPERAYRVNAAGTAYLASAARESGAALVYISTNYVFDGESDTAYHEFAAVNPISVYGHSKLAGEEAVRALCPRHAIVRTAMLYDESGRNFVNTMLRLAVSRPTISVVADQFGNPTYAGDLAVAIYQLIARRAAGTFHLVNQGGASWHEWASEIFRLTGVNVSVEPIPASAYQRRARPPRNGALVSLTAPAFGIELPHWADALQRCLDRRTALSDAQ
jgi:dTDP-4-dehydrorhamnose reductase